MILVGLCLAGSIGLFAGQPNTLAHLPWLVLLFPLCLYILAITAPTSRAAAARGFWLGLLGNSAALYWLAYPLHNVGGLPYILAAPCVLLLGAYLACYTALTSLAMRGAVLLLRGKGLLSCLAAPILGGLAFAGFEVISGFLFTGFPWLSLSSAFAFRPAWVQAASLVGSYGLTALYATAACLAGATLSTTGRKQVFAAALAFSLFFGPALYGRQRLAASGAGDAASSLSVIMVQGNVDQNQKWEPAFQRATLNDYMTLTESAVRRFRNENSDLTPDLVVWPETAMPFYFQLHQEYAEELRRFTVRNKISLVFGTLGIERGFTTPERLYNRLYLISPHGTVTGHYDKRHLVPFGEYIPFAAELEFLRNILQGLDFSPGSSSVTLQLALSPQGDTSESPIVPVGTSNRAGTNDSSRKLPQDSPRNVQLGTLICYEAIFPYLSQELVKNGANLLLNVSNDAWFGVSSAPLQHLSLTAMRAVEQARPIVRATNTGITAVIDAQGRVTTLSQGLFTQGAFIASVAPETKITLYHRLHPLPELFLAISALLLLIGYRLRQPGQGRKQPPPASDPK